MGQLRTVFAIGFVVFAVFALYKYAPDMVKGAQLLAAGIFNFISLSR